MVRKLEECILQPQSEIEKVRAFLLEKGYEFLEEDMVREDGKYYPMMKVRPPMADTAGEDTEVKCWDTVQLKYGKLLLEKQHPVLREYLEREIRIYQSILEGLKGKILTDPSEKRRIGTGTCRSRERDEILCSVKRLYR